MDFCTFVVWRFFVATFYRFQVSQLNGENNFLRLIFGELFERSEQTPRAEFCVIYVFTECQKSWGS